MDLVKDIMIGRSVDRLRDAPRMRRDELAALEKKLVETGAAAIVPVSRTLSHADARPAALAILDRLLTDATFGAYRDALASANPAVVSGMTQVLVRNKTYDAALLLDGLSDPHLPKSVLEQILMEQAHRIPVQRITALIGTLDKATGGILFRLLEKTTDPAVTRELAPLLRSDDWLVRLQTVKVLATFESDSAAADVQHLLQDTSQRVRLEAVKALHRWKVRQAVPALVESLRDPDLKVQTAAIDALCELGDGTTVRHLVGVLTDEQEHARRGAVEVLNEVATTEAIQDLIRALHDEDWWVRVRAADALGSLGGERVVEAVVGLLGASDEFLRRYAVEVLNTVPHEQAVMPLIQALQDVDWWVRERSIDALGTIGDTRAVAPLLDLLQHDDKALPLCVKSLGRIGDPAALEPIRRFVDSDREDVRREARVAVMTLSKRSQDGGLAPARDARKKGDTAPVKKVATGSWDLMRAAPAPSETASAPDSNRLASAAMLEPSAAVRIPAFGTRGPSAGNRDATSPRSLALNFAKLPEGTLLLDRYRILRRIGTGGFGTVYLVEDAAIRDEIILKILNPHLSVDDKELDRFVQELKLTRRISAKNVIRTYDLLDLGGVHAVSMEYFAGTDLRRLLDESGALPEQRVLEMTAQLCNGLTAAHDEKVIHRDIKPANILVGEKDTIKIVDFGLAWAQQRLGSRLTQSGLLMGTPEYMAPEIIDGGTVDHRADIYSLGIVMYEMLCGQKPYASDNVVRVLFQHLEGEARPLAGLVADLSPGVDAIVRCCMAREPNQRPQDLREVHTLVELELASARALEARTHA